MAEVVKIKKGLNINLVGKAPDAYAKASLPTEFGVRPDDFQGIVPRLAVKEGYAVKVGTELFHDKVHPEVKVVSPVSGVVSAINRGERRKILDIRIQSDGRFESEPYQKTEIDALSQEQLKTIFLQFGLWSFIRKRPYDIIASPDDKPKAVFVSAFDSAPLAPDYEFIFKDKIDFIQGGIDALAKLTNAPVYVGIRESARPSVFENLKNANLNYFDGPHPAGNVGVQINHISPVNKGEVVWCVNVQTLETIGKFFLNGKLDFTRRIALVGSEVASPAYYETVYGASIAPLVQGNIKNEKTPRYISGNPLSGTQIPADGFIGAFDQQLSVIPEVTEPEAFGWIMPRLDKFSMSRTYFSWLSKDKEYDLDTNVNGGERAIIVSNEYDKVFPMDIYPEYLIKAILDKDIDKMIALGIYEVAPEDFALCEFVDTSKLKLQKIVRDGLDYLRKEDE